MSEWDYCEFVKSKSIRGFHISWCGLEPKKSCGCLRSLHYKTCPIWKKHEEGRSDEKITM